MDQTAEAKAVMQDILEETEGKFLSPLPEPDIQPEDEAVASFKPLSEASSATKLDVCNILAGLLYGVKSDCFEIHSRQERRVNEARQLGIYLTNICLGVSYEEIAVPARRDRTTVRYSIERVEDRRENPQFDMALIAMETFIACLVDRDSVEMIESGLQVDFGRIAWMPLEADKG